MTSKTEFKRSKIPRNSRQIPRNIPHFHLPSYIFVSCPSLALCNLFAGLFAHLSVRYSKRRKAWVQDLPAAFCPARIAEPDLWRLDVCWP
eukprot:g77447.t1